MLVRAALPLENQAEARPMQSWIEAQT
jgi:hypothetical protein